MMGHSSVKSRGGIWLLLQKMLNICKPAPTGKLKFAERKRCWFFRKAAASALPGCKRGARRAWYVQGWRCPLSAGVVGGPAGASACRSSQHVRFSGAASRARGVSFHPGALETCSRIVNRKHPVSFYIASNRILGFQLGDSTSGFLRNF